MKISFIFVKVVGVIEVKLLKSFAKRDEHMMYHIFIKQKVSQIKQRQ